MFSGDKRTRILVLGAMCLALFMAMLDNTVVTVALPSIQGSFHSGVSGLQWIVSGYTLLFASLMLTGGTVGDIYGRRRAFLAGLTMFTAGSLVSGLAPSLSVLIAGRVFQGVGAALFLPGTLSLLTNTFTEPRERAQAIGLWAGVSGVALALGPVVGGLLVARFGWQSIFFLNLPIGTATLAIALRVVPESRHPEGRTLDLPGQALAVAALGTVTYALIQANSNGWTSPLTIGLLAAAALVQAAFLLAESRSPSPMLQLGFFRSRAFAAGVSIAGLVSFGTFGALFFLTLYIQNVQGYSALGMGVRALPLTCAIIVTAPLAGRMAGRIGSRVPLTLGLVLNAAGMLLLLRLTPTTSYGTLWWDLFMLGIGVGLVATPMTAAVMSAVPRARAGMASATTNASREIGGVFGVALLGAFMSRFYASGLSSRLGSLAGSAEAKARIASLARRGGQLAGASFPGVSARQLHTIVGQAFVAGMRPAIAVAGGALLIGAVVAAVFVPSGVPAVEVPAEGAAAPSAETEAALAGRPGAGAPGRRKTGAEKEAA